MPEPAALGMFGLGVLLIGVFTGWRRRVADVCPASSYPANARKRVVFFRVR
ncbi:MAG: PEP-CTERM sorting domain-containing protein [Xanthomonadaceae bacterium]|nr:PEP-CTERM sorting domain-containing protein [Xanthomonadaceae bacterium]